MRGFIAAAFLALSFVASCMAGKTLPKYHHLYSLSVSLSDNHPVEGPLGTRFGLSAVSGNMTSSDGKIIATAVPGVGGETGLVDKNGNFQISVRSIWQFVDDKKYAYIEGSGIGPLTGNPLEIQHVETDSPSRHAWNGCFIVANVTLSSANHLMIDAFKFENGV